MSCILILRQTVMVQLVRHNKEVKTHGKIETLHKDVGRQQQECILPNEAVKLNQTKRKQRNETGYGMSWVVEGAGAPRKRWILYDLERKHWPAASSCHGHTPPMDTYGSFIDWLRFSQKCNILYI